MLQALCNSSPAAAAALRSAATTTILPTAVLDNLSARFRPSGLCLLMLDPNGAVVYHDSSIGLFFQRFALPMVQYPEPADLLAQRVRSLNINSTVEVWNILPGVVLTAFPYVEKRQLVGVLLLAAKGSTFGFELDLAE